MSGKWITIMDAAKRFGIEQSSLRERVNRRGIEARVMPIPGMRRTCKWIMERDLEELRQPIACNPEIDHNRTARARRIARWADSLPSWPSDEEIQARCDGPYQFKDIESVIENRPWRGLRPIERRSRTI